MPKPALTLDQRVHNKFHIMHRDKLDAMTDAQYSDYVRSRGRCIDSMKRLLAAD